MSRYFGLLIVLLALGGSHAARLFADDIQGKEANLMGSRFGADLADYTEDTLEEEEGDERFLFTSTTSVTVNSTLLRAIGAIIGALLLALPLYLAYATASGGSSGGGSGGYGSHRKRRYRREGEDDLASHVYALLESFRKKDLADSEGCQLMVACEAGLFQDKEHPKFGQLTRKVHKILSTVPLAERELEATKNSEYIDSLMRAHDLGQGRRINCFETYKDSCPKIKQ